jgi:YD repeat-containing protein
MEIDVQPVVTQLVLPDKRSVSFLYNEFGEVVQVNLPTGASIQYDYNTATLPSGITPSQETQSQLNSLGLLSVDRAVVARRTYEPGSTTAEGTWTYSYGLLAQTNTTATSPATDITCTGGGQLLLHERHFFNPAGRYLSYGLNIGLKGMEGTGYTLWSTGLEFRTETLDANLS